MDITERLLEVPTMGHDAGCVAEAAEEIKRLRARIASAPFAIMDNTDLLGIYAPTEEDFPALYALRGKRVRLVLDEVPNAPDQPGRTGQG